ncbi:MAG: RES family NAD+ phosphorylase [Chloroflexota bacterium]
MNRRLDQDLHDTVAALPFQHWEGHVWRTHWSRLAATDWSPSLRSTGRYHHAGDRFSEGPTWPALYTSLAPQIAVWETVHRSVTRNVRHLENQQLTGLEIAASSVFDFRNPAVLGLTREDLTGPNPEIPWLLAQVAVEQGAGGILVPSAALQGDNLVLFPSTCRAFSPFASSAVRLCLLIFPQVKADRGW